MKIMNESKKEALPLDFLTSFVSKGWEEIGLLKANIEGIRREFTGTKKIEDILSNLVDAYLVCVGQLELYINKKDYLDLPSSEQINESLEDFEDDVDNEEDSAEQIEEESDNAEEAVKVLKNKVDIHSEEDSVVISEKGQLNNPEAPKIEVEASEEELDVLAKEFSDKANKDNKDGESFEFFTDFDEPEKLEEGYSPFREWTKPHNSID